MLAHGSQLVRIIFLTRNSSVHLELRSFFSGDVEASPLSAKKRLAKPHFCWDLVIDENGVTKCIICGKTIPPPGPTNISVYFKHHPEAWNRRKEEWEAEPKKLKSLEKKVSCSFPVSIFYCFFHLSVIKHCPCFLDLPFPFFLVTRCLFQCGKL